MSTTISSPPVADPNFPTSQAVSSGFTASGVFTPDELNYLQAILLNEEEYDWTSRSTATDLALLLSIRGKLGTLVPTT